MSTLTNGMDPATAGAWEMLRAQLDQWGLGSLADQAKGFLIDGYDMQSIPTMLQETPEYKQRFSANDARVKNGLAALTPADYVATENSYRQVMQQYGLPGGFYDQVSDFSNFIANDVSPSEVNERAKTAQQVWLSADPLVKQTWTNFYGLSDGAAIASILDPKTALPIVQQHAQAAQIGAAATRNGLVANRANDELYSDLGITGQKAEQVYGQIGATWGSVQQMANRFGTQFTQADAEQANLTGSGPGVAKQAALFDSEKALFAQRGSADQNTESQRNAGSY